MNIVLQEVKLVVSVYVINKINVGGRIQYFPDWPLGTRTANGTALCH
jgi:hypothetical protein